MRYPTHSAHRRRGLPWHRRLEARVLVSLTAVAGSALALALFAAGRTVTEHALEQSARQLHSARSVYYQLARHSADLASGQCRLIAELPVFRASLNLGDRPTMEGVAAEYCRKLGAAFCIVTDARGRWLGSPGWAQDQPPPAALLTGIAAARAGRPYRGYVALGARLFLVTCEPARFGDEVLGTLTAGYLRDDAAARELARMTGCEVSFVYQGRLCGTSLRNARKPALQELLDVRPDLPEQPVVRAFLQPLGAEQYVAGAYPLTSHVSVDDPGRLILLQAWRPTQEFLDAVKAALSSVMGLAFLLALAGGLVLSRRITRPLREMATVAEEIAAGDWGRRAREQGSAEVAAMAAAFNHMTASLRHWHHEAQSRSERLEATLMQLQQAHDATLEALSRALDTRDNETEGHSLRVTHYALRLAEEMGLAAEERSALRWGALLHDIGKIGVPDAILHKPGRLTPAELRAMRRHCELGLHIVRGIPHLERAAEVIGCHHEHFDGNGYPAGLAREAIPLLARVFAVADSLDAITSDRPYRAAGSFAEAMAEIRRHSGTQFDPRVVAALEAMIDELEAWRTGAPRVGATGPSPEAERVGTAAALVGP